PYLPDRLRQLYCNDNDLDFLPPLPDSLLVLVCADNNLTSLPPLPEGFSVLNCMDNLLDSLPALPASLSDLYCANNNLAAIPPLPYSLHVFRIANNPSVTCLPPLYSFTGPSWAYSIENTGVTCLPIYPQHQGFEEAIDTMPLCQTGNSGGCAVMCGAPVTDTLVARICGGESFRYANYALNQTGTYDFDLVASSGCDSIFVIELTVDTPGTEVVVNAGVLSVSGGVTYQWHGCLSNIPIIGATNDMFVPWWTSSFYVVVTDSNGCVGVTDCIEVSEVGIQSTKEPGIQIAPNPANRVIFINVPPLLGGNLTITDSSGRVVLECKPEDQLIDVGSFFPGTYFVSCRENQLHKNIGTFVVIP
ncbi:MAG TPA: hypothetical protein VEY71_03100, partial [Chitinophagales bacterium]|nr:hypothetical protein [Chitinophagales bacterium]